MLCWCCKPWSVCAFIISMERLAFLYNNKKTCQKLGNVVCALYFFVMTTSLTLLLKAKEEGQGTLQPIFTNNSRWYCSRTDCFVYIQLHFNNIRIIKMTPDRPGRHWFFNSALPNQLGVPPPWCLVLLLLLLVLLHLHHLLSPRRRPDLDHLLLVPVSHVLPDPHLSRATPGQESHGFNLFQDCKDGSHLPSKGFIIFVSPSISSLPPFQLLALKKKNQN